MSLRFITCAQKTCILCGDTGHGFKKCDKDIPKDKRITSIKKELARTASDIKNRWKKGAFPYIDANISSRFWKPKLKFLAKLHDARSAILGKRSRNNFNPKLISAYCWKVYELMK